MIIISEYYGMQEDLKSMRMLKEGIIEDFKIDLPEFKTEARHVLAEHDRLARIVDEQILTFSDTTLSAEEHETRSKDLLHKLQHQRIDDKRAWSEFLGNWYIHVEVASN